MGKSHPAHRKNSYQRWRKYWWVFSLLVFLAAFLKLINIKFPNIGHDYPYLFDRLLVGNWHIYHQGLWPPYYSAYFCGGGTSIYGHPEDVFYSLLQFSAYFIDFWTAVNLTAAANLALGYLGWYLVGRHVLHLPKKWCHLLSLLVLTNGFYLLHAAVGHWNFLPLPVAGLLIWCIFDRRHDSTNTLLLRISIFSLSSGWIFYSAGYLVLLFWLIAAAIILPFDLIISRGKLFKRSKTLLFRLCACGLGSLSICASKFSLVYLLIQAYPRTTALWNTFPPERSLWFALRNFFFSPLSNQVLADIPGSLHEKGLLLSPVILIGLACGLFLLTKQFPKNKQSGLALSLGIAYSLFVAIFFSQLVSGNGYLADTLHQLPVLSSLRISTRFLYIPSLFLTTLSVWCLAHFSKKYLSKVENYVVLLCLVITLSVFYLGHANTIKNEIDLGRSYHEHLILRAKLLPTGGLPTPVTQVNPGWADHLGGTGMDCADGLLVWAGSSALHRKNLHAGPVTDQASGYYNIMKPACLLFPTENNCLPGDKIPISDKENFGHFISGQKVNWKISRLQKLSNSLSFSWATTSLAILVILASAQFMPPQKSIKSNQKRRST